MPLSQPVVRQSLMGSVVAEVVKKSSVHSGGFRVAVNVAQCVEGPIAIGILESRAVISLFPKMSRAIEHSIEAHRRIPVEPVHDFR